jgi:UDP-glucuronate decarboxylase
VHQEKENYWGNVNPTGLRFCYNEGKRCAETIIDASITRRRGFPRIVRAMAAWFRIS